MELYCDADVLSTERPDMNSKPEELHQKLHDIRTPLGTIFGLADLYALTAKTSQEREMAATLKSTSKRLQEELDDLFLTLTTPPSGQIATENNPDLSNRN